MNNSRKLAFWMILLIVLWLLSGLVFPSNNTAEEAVEASEANIASRVAWQRVVPQRKEQWVNLYGETEPNRMVALKAETSGPIIAIPKKEGDMIKAGETLVKIDLEDRRERLAQAKALREQRRIEYRAASKLKKDGFSTAVTYAESKAQLAQSEADVKRAEIDLARSNVKAPFDGRVENIYAELGDFVGVNVFGAEGSIAEIVDLDPILVTASLPQQHINFMKDGAKAEVTINDNQPYTGTVRYVSRMADQKTRTFKVEIAIDNKQGDIVAGVAAKLRVLLREVDAYALPSSALVLADDGRVGVKTVVNGEARFADVTVIEETRDGIWVTGLMGEVDVVTSGQAYLAEGQQVEGHAVGEKSATASANVASDAPARPKGADDGESH